MSIQKCRLFPLSESRQFNGRSEQIMRYNIKYWLLFRAAKEECFSYWEYRTDSEKGKEETGQEGEKGVKK